mgnify:CR=1 FL=1
MSFAQITARLTAPSVTAAPRYGNDVADGDDWDNDDDTSVGPASKRAALPGNDGTLTSMNENNANAMYSISFLLWYNL